MRSFRTLSTPLRQEIQRDSNSNVCACSCVCLICVPFNVCLSIGSVCLGFGAVGFVPLDLDIEGRKSFE